MGTRTLHKQSTHGQCPEMTTRLTFHRRLQFSLTQQCCQPCTRSLLTIVKCASNLPRLEFRLAWNVTNWGRACGRQKSGASTPSTELKRNLKWEGGTRPSVQSMTTPPSQPHVEDFYDIGAIVPIFVVVDNIRPKNHGEVSGLGPAIGVMFEPHCCKLMSLHKTVTARGWSNIQTHAFDFE